MKSKNINLPKTANFGLKKCFLCVMAVFSHLFKIRIGLISSHSKKFSVGVKSLLSVN